MDHDRLQFLLELHHGEVRAQVDLGWRRMAFFLQTSAVLSIGAAFVNDDKMRIALNAIGAVVALLGAFVVRRGHSYYVGARDAMKRVERELGYDGFTFATTPGQRGQRVRPRIVDAATAALLVIAAVHLIVLAL